MPRVLKLLALLLSLSVAVPLVGCPKQVSSAQYAAGKALAGTWKDDAGATYVIEFDGSQPRMTHVVDYDQEVFQIQQTGWRAGLFHAIYLVPSTQYTVDITFTDQPSADLVNIEWRNQYDSGSESWYRSP